MLKHYTQLQFDLRYEYSEFVHYLIQYSLIPGYTGIRAAWERPELESQLTSKAASSKRPRSLGFFLQRGLTCPWPLFQGTRVISPRTWKPVNLHNQHHTLPQRIWNKMRGPKYSLRIISKFGKLSYHTNLLENESRECGSCRDGWSPRVESTATIT